MQTVQALNASTSGRERNGSLSRTYSEADRSQEDASLFDTPGDLICPITHDVFREPVINSVGQVYERAAIEQHLKSRLTDPVTNTPLPSPHLTPVYILRSRALEYREQVAKECIERACSPAIKNPLRYLRRAAELVHGVDIRVPGLSPEVTSYLLTHSSNAYDFLALQNFADGLRRAGYTEQATNVFFRLLEMGDDLSQQAWALRQCLACWSHGEPEQASKSVIPRLASFIEQQHTFTAGQIVEIMGEAGQSQQLVVELCEYLLMKHLQDDGTTKYKDLMVHYTQLRFAMLQAQLDEMKRSGHMSSPAAKRSPAHAAPSQPDLGHQPHANGDAHGALHHENSNGRHSGVWQVWRFLSRRKKMLASCGFAALSLLNPAHQVVRIGQAASLLLLVHTPLGET